MVTINDLSDLALSFPATSEAAHFEKTAFKVKNKIFATYDAKNNRVCIKLSLIDQDVFSISAQDLIYPVPNKWGKQGWTFIEMSKVKKSIFTDALTTAYCEVAPKNLSLLVRPDE
ncbi:MAG TPA: MmcQ/YjbR family DNA-binding protein [Chitinophagaceae bacterium]|jgi:predicted DNA-binding protein (MmcQ/YjbR family)|nr:MmcQ/YjbR family DNA-binding protein [Chitinophagaceae bacterium]